MNTKIKSADIFIEEWSRQYNEWTPSKDRNNDMRKAALDAVKKRDSEVWKAAMDFFMSACDNEIRDAREERNRTHLPPLAAIHESRAQNIEELKNKIHELDQQRKD